MYKIVSALVVGILAGFGFITKLDAQSIQCPDCLRSGVELVSNGNFSQGNTGFSSSYGYFNQTPPPNMGEGLYAVVANPAAIHTGFTSCPDHTTGTGNQMVINGATQTNVTLWCQTINVNPNTDYLFSTWVQSVVSGNPALLQFSINGVTLGSPFSPPLATCQWAEFFTTWNSGSNTTASICIVNQNTSFGGNDFSLDDISFMECVPIVPLNASVLYSDAGCFGANDGLATPNSGQAWNGVPPYTYVWFDGTNDPVKDSLAPGNYFLVVSDSVGCVDTVNFTITSAPDFTIDLGPDTLNCFGAPVVIKNLALNQPGSVVYQWNNGGTDYLTTADTSGTYVLCGTIGLCTKCDSINVTISPDFTVDIGPPDTTFCLGGNGVVLNAGNPGANYLWSTGDTTYTINADSSGLYWVGVWFDSTCVKYDTIQVSQSVCTSVVFVPNVFTPNGDGVNDNFIAMVSGIVTDVNIVIFNRWGLQVYESDDVNFAWDGTIGGQDANDSVYYWILTYVDNNGNAKQLTGTVTLLKG
ncbi:MAG: gliding motility-associated C-terminal domain-containing protein [Sphingobacteriales bacterium JAD_PAG50586_3]|nr:MAG: gliding motility-associated C-terminal domain-containing protein [Sphingobacteriales bacterium JAD_PAG50586_3]